MAEEFRRQLALGAPSNEDEAGLRRLDEKLAEFATLVEYSLPNEDAKQQEDEKV